MFDGNLAPWFNDLAILSDDLKLGIIVSRPLLRLSQGRNLSALATR